MATSRKALARATTEENRLVKKHTTINMSQSELTSDSTSFCLTLVPRDFVQDIADPYTVKQGSPHCFSGRGYSLKRLQLEAMLCLKPQETAGEGGESRDSIFCRCIVIRFPKGIGGNAVDWTQILDSELYYTGSADAKRIGPLSDYKKWYQADFDTGDNPTEINAKIGKYNILYDRKILLNNDHERFFINFDYRPSGKYNKVMFNNTLGYSTDAARPNEPYSTNTGAYTTASIMGEDMQNTYRSNIANICNAHGTRYVAATTEATAQGHIWMLILLEPGAYAAGHIPEIKYRWTKWFWDAK